MPLQVNSRVPRPRRRAALSARICGGDASICCRPGAPLGGNFTCCLGHAILQKPWVQQPRRRPHAPQAASTSTCWSVCAATATSRFFSDGTSSNMTRMVLNITGLVSSNQMLDRDRHCYLRRAISNTHLKQNRSSMSNFGLKENNSALLCLKLL